MLGITDFSLSFLTSRPFITTLIFILFILLSIWLYRRTNPPLPPRLKVILAALRIIAVIALFLALFEPVVSYKRVFERKPRLTVMLDRSGSMNITEDDQNREQRAEQFLQSSAFDDFSDSFDIDIIPFAGDLALEGSLGDTDRTAIGEVLQELSRSQIGNPAEVWMILSDGISNHGIAPSEIAVNLKSPVYALGVGEEKPEKDAAVTDIEYNDIIFAGKPTDITVRLQWSGIDNENARISVKSGDRTHVRQNVKLGEGDLQDEIDIRFTPEKPGRQTFEVALSGIEGETTEANNRRSFSVNVLKSKLKVLLVAGYLDWEYSFLKRFLERSESVELTPVVFKQGGGYLTGSVPDRQTEMNQYDLIILYDPVYDRIKGRADLFESYLKDNGGGIFVLLGPNYLKENSPRWIDRFLPFSVTHNRGELIHHRFNAIPMENYLFHPAVRIGENRREIRNAWRELPHFQTIVPLDSISEGSEILVVSDLGQGPDAIPALSLRRFGPGKVLASSVAPFWPWAFYGYGFDQQPREYNLFWNGVVNWLALKEESEPVRIFPQKNIYTRGEQIVFNASVYDLGFRPITRASGYVSLKGEQSSDSTVAQFIEIGEGKYRAEFELMPPGRYNWTGIIDKEGKRLKESSGQIAVEAYTIEEFRRRPEFGTLTALAQMTGGDFAPLDRSDSLLNRIESSPVTVVENHEFTVWNKLWLLIIFITALGIEWFLRKRHQLI